MNNRLLLLTALALAGCGPASPPQRAPLEGARIGGPFALVDQDGRTVTDRSFAGKYRLMYFGYTFCPDVCPQDMANVGAGLKLLERSDPALARRVVPVFVTVDPERDTPAVLKQFVANFHPRMVGLTGSPQALGTAEKAYAVYAKKGEARPGGYLMDHTRQVYLMDPDGRPLALIPAEKGSQAVADEIARWAS
jgi:protein SCO1/2